MNELFSIHRFWWLLRSHGMSFYRPLITLTITLGGMLTFFAVLNREPGDGFYGFSFGALLYVLGLVFSARAFRELHDKTRNTAYLLVPASTLEKMLAQLFIGTVGLVVYLMVLVSIVSLIAEPLAHLFLNRPPAPFNPLGIAVWQTVPGYLFLQSIYFLGAAWFRRGHLVKTTLTLFLASIALAIFVTLVVRIVFAPYWQYAGGLEINFAGLSEAYGGMVRVLLYGLGVLWVAMCWYVAWLRIRETQVSHGV